MSGAHAATCCPRVPKHGCGITLLLLLPTGKAGAPPLLLRAAETLGGSTHSQSFGCSGPPVRIRDKTTFHRGCGVGLQVQERASRGLAGLRQRSPFREENHLDFTVHNWGRHSMAARLPLTFTLFSLKQTELLSAFL